MTILDILFRYTHPRFALISIRMCCRSSGVKGFLVPSGKDCSTGCSRSVGGCGSRSSDDVGLSKML